jgi:hypothetical protein
VRPWQPRPGPHGWQRQDGEQGQPPQGPPPGAPGPHGPGPGPGPGQGPQGSPWGGQWGERRPGWPPPGPFDREGGPGGTGQSQPPRFDPTDPAQRRARYALLCGIWGLFFTLLVGWTSLGLLLGALALHWGISALRTKPEEREQARAATLAALSRTPHRDGDDAPAQPPTPPQQPGPPPGARTPDGPAAPGVPPGPPSYPPGPPYGPLPARQPQRNAAVTGIVTAAISLALVATGFTVHVVYKDYFDCRHDALTSVASASCDAKLPKPLRGRFG